MGDTPDCVAGVSLQVDDEYVHRLIRDPEPGIIVEP